MRRPPLLAMTIALVGGLLVGLLVLRSNAPPDLTVERLEAARTRWESRGPASYTLEIEMQGALEDRRRIEVRNGRVTEMSVGERPASEDSRTYWSVDGLFDFLEAELRNAADPPPELGVSDSSQIVLKAAFDRRLGYPESFLRHILGRQQSTGWQVVSFEPHPPS
ncbi:MAG: DUF6174 domain-containing protein [Thermoanaerobaculia bacterium]|nr:DUF6174 domain-containing protein [Thermoanaerobaculia bacterium]